MSSEYSEDLELVHQQFVLYSGLTLMRACEDGLYGVPMGMSVCAKFWRNPGLNQSGTLYSELYRCCEQCSGLESDSSAICVSFRSNQDKGLCWWPLRRFQGNVVRPTYCRPNSDPSKMNIQYLRCWAGRRTRGLSDKMTSLNSSGIQHAPCLPSTWRLHWRSHSSL